jgi:hypothetical protein
LTTSSFVIAPERSVAGKITRSGLDTLQIAPACFHGCCLGGGHA